MLSIPIVPTRVDDPRPESSDVDPKASDDASMRRRFLSGLRALRDLVVLAERARARSA
ncbi:MAG: hypothetical protein KF773_37750 [Deltaproteobacteria bacterium]|nr:hypothetical protein [Deltaproteobacteria bacterium]MCW5802351.1 hypothetical protein [Deltaproteobacteria bacterium]